MRRPARATDLVVDGRGLARWRGRLWPCAVGRGGFVADKREGDLAAPIGTFRLTEVLYRADRGPAPATALPLRPIGPSDLWSDDPRDPAYNQPVTAPHPWRCERLRRADRLYDVVVVFDANRSPAVPGRGSALFLHLWRKPRHPTAGCVAFERAVLRRILAEWRAASRLILRA